MIVYCYHFHSIIYPTGVLHRVLCLEEWYNKRGTKIGVTLHAGTVAGYSRPLILPLLLSML